MNMIDLGRTIKPLSEQPMGTGETKSKKKFYPTMYLDVVPDELKSKPVGHVCRLTIVVKVLSQRETQEGMQTEIEVRKAGYASAGQKTKDEYLQMPEKDREKYDKESIEDEDKDEEDEEDDPGSGE